MLLTGRPPKVTDTVQWENWKLKVDGHGWQDHRQGAGNPPPSRKTSAAEAQEAGGWARLPSGQPIQAEPVFQSRKPSPRSSWRWSPHRGLHVGPPGRHSVRRCGSTRMHLAQCRTAGSACWPARRLPSRPTPARWRTRWLHVDAPERRGLIPGVACSAWRWAHLAQCAEIGQGESTANSRNFAPRPCAFRPRRRPR